MEFITKSPEETKAFGEKWGQALQPGDIVALVGELGAGKTCLVQGLLRGLNVKDKYSGRSSTFVLINEYEGRLPVYHFDIYRLNDLREMIDLGYEEYLYGRGVTIIEWADKMGNLLPKDCIKVELLITDIDQRCLKILSSGEHNLFGEKNNENSCY